MASNNGKNPLPQRAKGGHKKNKENRDKLLKQLKEMFGTSFDAEIITSVAQSCEWKLEPALDALITLASEEETNIPDFILDEMKNMAISKNENTKSDSYDPWKDEKLPWEESEENKLDNVVSKELDFLNFSKEELLQQKEELLKFQESRSENRSSSSPEDESFSQRMNTTSLCGLKIEYRPKDLQSTSDDDADIVIEAETCDFNDPQQSTHNMNICQLLSMPTQDPSKNKFSKVQCKSPNQETAAVIEIPVTSALTQIEEDIKRNYKIMILMRGAPGCGKTFLAQSIIKKTMGGDIDNHIFSADDYFAKINGGTYAFDASKLHDAHMYCQNRVYNAARQGWSPIIVDNTNTQTWEMETYAKLAVEYGYILETLEPPTPWARNVNELDKRNKHSVPKTKIRLMLDRYETNISGRELLQALRLSYSATTQPPLLRKHPPLTAPKLEDTAKVRNTSLHKGQTVSPQRRVRRPKKPNEDQAQSTNSGEFTENNSLSKIASAYVNLELNCSNLQSSGINETKSFNDLWSEGSSYKEDSFFDLAKHGAIGSERKGTTTEIKALEYNSSNAVDNFKSEAEDVKVPDVVWPGKEINIQSVDKDLMVDHIYDELFKDHEISPKNKITDFVNKDSEQSKLEETIVKNTDINVASTSEGISSTNKETASKDVLNYQDSDFEKNNVTDDSNKESAMSSDKTSNSSDVDMSQFELCNEEVIANVEKTEDKNPGSLGSFLNFIKNSFLGTEKEKTINLPSDLSNENTIHDTSLVQDRLTQKLRNSDDSASNSWNLSATISPSEIAMDTLSDKLLNFNGSSSNSSEDKNLICEVQEAVTLIDNVNSQEERRVASNVIEQLLEASSDFQLTEQLDYFERRQDEKKINNVMSEKTFIEQIKNLQVHANSQDEQLESVDSVCEAKNVYPDNTQNHLIQSSKLSSNNSIVNNANAIDWSEPSFPIDFTPKEDSVLPVLPKPKVEDVGTSTDTYDFNLLYIGSDVSGEIEGYKFMNAFNRNINEDGVILPPVNSSTRQVNFEKSCMTNMDGVFYEETATRSIVNIKSEEGLLFEIYPDLSRCLITYVYETLCSFDFEYSVDYLCNLQEDNATLEYISEKLESWNNEEFETDEFTPFIQDNTDPDMPSKRFKNARPLDLPIQFPETSYPENVLKVKRSKEKRNASTPSQKKDFLKLPLSWEAVNMLESFCGKTVDRDGIEPVLSLTKSTADKLYSMWEQSVEEQKAARKKKMDEALARDAAFARAEQDKENAAAGVQMFGVGENMGFKEIMKSTSRQRRNLNALEKETEESKNILSNNVLKYKSLSYEEIIAVAESARDRASRHHQERANFIESAKTAQSIDDYEMAKHYSELVQLHSKEMDAANAEAVLAYWTAQSMKNDENTFDLHGFHMFETTVYVDQFIDNHLDSMACGTRKQIIFITGQGKNSPNGQSKLKPLVINLLKKRNISFKIGERNPGMIIAVIQKQSEKE